MGLNGLEPSTSRLSGVRSNQLSYKPILLDDIKFSFNTFFELKAGFSFNSIWQPPTLPCRLQQSTIGRLSLNRRVRDGNGCLP